MSDHTIKILISNLMMLKERERFDREIRDLGAVPVWANVRQYLNEEECLPFAGEVDAWAAGDDRITRSVMKAFLPRLRGIVKWGTGLDSIDLDAAKELGLPVYNSPGTFADAVSEVAIGYMLMLTRHLSTVDRAVRAGHWPKPMGIGLAGRTLGLIGFGAIGQGIAKRAKGLKMHVIAYDPPMMHLGKHDDVPLIELDDLCSRADVLCIACNLTPESCHLVNKRTIGLLKQDAIVVNVARGPVIDESALISALQEGQIAGAGLDVYEQEPLPKNNPLVGMDNVVLGSHNANNLQSAVEYVHSNTMANLRNLIAPFQNL